MKPTVRFHIHGHAHSEAAIGPGKIALLEAIGSTGSITAAARQLGMSYRRAWMLVDETNRCLVQAAVNTTTGGKRGGGASLTPSGVKLVRTYRALERQTGSAVSRKLGLLLRDVR